MDLNEFQLTVEEFRSTPHLRDALAELLLENDDPNARRYRTALILALQAIKNEALMPKLPSNSPADAVNNAYWQSQGIAAILRLLNQMAMPLHVAQPPNPDTHFFDRATGDWYEKDILPENLRADPPKK